MTWTAPLTATAHTAFASADFNTYVRDNLLETEAAKAVFADANAKYKGRYFTTAGSHSIALRAPVKNSSENIIQSTTSTSYTILPDLGCSVKANTGVTALVFFTCAAGNSVAGGVCAASIAVSGATTIAAADDWAIRWSGLGASDGIGGFMRRGMVNLFTVNAGDNIFKLKVKVGANTGYFRDPTLIVMPF